MGIEPDLAAWLILLRDHRQKIGFRLTVRVVPWLLREGLKNGTLGGAETDEEIAYWCGADDLYICDEEGNTLREWHNGQA